MYICVVAIHLNNRAQCCCWPGIFNVFFKNGIFYHGHIFGHKTAQKMEKSLVIWCSGFFTQVSICSKIPILEHFLTKYGPCLLPFCLPQAFNEARELFALIVARYAVVAVGGVQPGAVFVQEASLHVYTLMKHNLALEDGIFICGAADRSGRGKRCCSSCCCCHWGGIFQSLW